MSLVLLSDLDVRIDGPGLEMLRSGWSHPETDNIWAIDSASEMIVRVPARHPSYVVLLSLVPANERQRVSVWSDGHPLGSHLLSAPADIALSVPAWLVDDGRLTLWLLHDDGLVPPVGDDRRLSVTLSRIRLYGSSAACVLPAPETRHVVPDRLLLGRFQSFGDTCEFGLVQRKAGAEPLHLLRFSGMRLVNLVLGLATRFDGLAELGNIDFWLSGGTGLPTEEYMVLHKIYGLNSHSYRNPQKIDADTFRATTLQSLRYLHRKLMEDLEEADQIFVLKRHEPLSLDEVLPLWSMMRGYGTNTLLYVVPAGPGHAAGSVEWMAPGLMRGHIDRFAPVGDINDISINCWLAICRRAHCLWQDALPPDLADTGRPGGAPAAG